MSNSISYKEAIDKIVKNENLNTNQEHYLGTYDVALSVIYGKELYTGSYDCSKRAKELRK